MLFECIFICMSHYHSLCDVVKVCLTFDQSVFIRWRRSGEDSQLWPNLINALLLNLQRKREEFQLQTDISSVYQINLKSEIDES